SATAAARPSTILFIIGLEGDHVAALELQDLARLRRACDLEGEIFEDRADAADLVAVRLGELALADIDRILEADADVAAHHGSHRHEGQLMAPGGEHRPGVLIAEQLVGDPLHMGEVFGVGADAAENAEDRLHEERRLDQLAVKEMRQRVEMADIVAFELELRAAALAKRLKDLLDSLEGIPKNEIPGILQMLGFPVVFPLLVAIE